MTYMMWLSISFMCLGGILWFCTVGVSDEPKNVGIYLFLTGFIIFIMEEWIIPFFKWGHKFM